MPVGQLLERERELEAIGGLMAAARGRSGGLLIVEGAAGVGKSELLAAAAALAAESGMAVLAARGEELERSAPWGLVQRMLMPAIDATQRRAMLGDDATSAALFGEPAAAQPVAGADDVLRIANRLFWLIADVAESGPVLLVIDDAHWADEQSLRLVAYLMSRLGDLQVAVLLAKRSDEVGDGGPVLTAIAADARVRRLPLASLSLSASAMLVRAALGTELPDGVVEACAAVTGGNPFYLRELLLELVKLPAGSLTARAIERLAPESVSRAVFVRLGRLDSVCVRFARAVAVFGDDCAFPHASELAGLDVEVATRALDALAGAAILRAMEPLGFVHPLVAEALRADLGAGERGELHGRAARILARDGAESEKVAAHLMQSGGRGDPWVVERLRAAAAIAVARGATTVAAGWLERALREPVVAEQRAGLLIELARVEVALGRAEAVERLGAAAELVEVGEERARVSAELGRALALQGRIEDAAAVLEQGIDQLGDAEPELGRELRAAWWSVASLQVSLRARARAVGGAVALPSEQERPTPGERQLLAQLAMHGAFEGADHDHVLGLAERAWGSGELLAIEGSDGVAWPMVTGGLLAADELERGVEVCDAVLADARRRGSPMAFASASYTRAWPLLSQGRVSDAVADAEAAIQARHDGWAAWLGGAVAILVFAQIERAQLSAAREALALVEHDEQLKRSTQHPLILIAAGRLLVAEDLPADALERLLSAGEMLSAAGIECPSPMPWRTDAAFAAVLAGDRDRARSLADAALIAATCAGAPLAVARSLRAIARTEHGEHAIERYRQALAQLDGLPPRLERSYCLVELGAALRRARRRADARAVLQEALALAERGGALALAATARVELAAAGAHASRQPRDGVVALTPSERRVAEMVAGGMTNRAVAQALFVTVKAVEYHLANTYRKLDVAGRDQLAQALGAADPES
jgi:DNA-binding CsgD family transcriptional regulator